MNKVEEAYLDLNNFEKFLVVLGAFFFLLTFALTFTQTGFQLDRNAVTPIENVFTTTELWIVNISSGTIGGFLLRYKNHLIAAIGGALIAAGITGFTFLYLGFRESIYVAEIFLPLVIGVIPGFYAYKYMCKAFKRKL